MRIRPEEPGDAVAVARVLTEAFPTSAEAELVADLRAAGNAAVSLVAVDGRQVCGNVVFSPVTIDGGADGLGLAPLAVLPDRQREGIGTLLVRAALQAADRGYVVVLGDPAYYGRFGFRPASALGLSSDFGAGPEFQVLVLRPGALPARGGRVRYSPEFDRFK